MYTKYRTQCLLTSALTAVLLLAPQSKATAQAQTAETPETVTVSASRITAAGFAAPTPTTVVGVADIQTNAMPDVFDTLSQLPALQSSTGTNSATSSQNGNTSTGENGISALNLRGLGTIRTLTLLDSQRIVPSFNTGIADMNLLPQLLIQRVDVVTGGASASWGSDAVGGVVNIITDKNFDGIKGNIEGGMSNFSDDDNGEFQLAAGTELFGGKGHIEADGEFYHNDGVPAPRLAYGLEPNGRCCNLIPGTLSYALNSTPAGTPEYTPVLGAQGITSSRYGLILSGPLKGEQFNADGSLSPFNYGSPCVGNTCVGGDLSNVESELTVDDPITRSVFYTRLSYDITPDIDVYGTVNFGSVYTFDTPASGSNTSASIACGANPAGDNYYLSASVNAACVANHITSFTEGISYDNVPPIQIHTLRQQRRFVLGTDGQFSAFGSDWTFDAYFEHGENDTSIHMGNIILPAHVTAALNSVAGPNGSVVCAGSVAQADGCVPMSPFGSPLTPVQSNWIAPSYPNGPFNQTNERQEAGGIAINGTPFKDWAGDVALAYGVEYREEAYKTGGDPYGNGTAPSSLAGFPATSASPNDAQYPYDPLLTSAGSNWTAGNYHNGGGNYHVAETFLEAGIPLVNNAEFGKADFDIAGRAADYSTSGYNDTWKLGLTWDTPLDGVRLRALQSRDVRAPNLSELFAAPITMNNFVINRQLPITAPTVEIVNDAIGNPDLKPEAAQTTELGVVFTPDYLPGFNFSADYYRVAIKREIGSLTNQNIVDLCQLYGNSSYCNFVNLNGAYGTSNPSYVIVEPFNIAEAVTDGFDFEGSYAFDGQAIDLPGNFALRALATHVSKFISNTGILGNPISELAGSEAANSATTDFGGGVPLWKVFATETWNINPVSFTVTERGYSQSVFNPYAVVCQAPNCPAPTAQNPTYASNSLPGYFYVDLGGTYQVSDLFQTYFKVNNVGDILPKPFATLGSDPIGRMYFVGLRFTY